MPPPRETRPAPAPPRRPRSATAAGRGPSKPAAEEAPQPAPKPPRSRGAGASPPMHGTAAQPRRARRMNAAQAADFIRALAVANPAPETELLYQDPFTLLVAVVLSAQTTDAAVNRCTPSLFAAAPTPAAMAALGEVGIGPHIRSIGLWQGKARNVAALARTLVEQHGGAVPRAREALEALPGVGRKTANVVLNVAFGEATMAVDTHIFRIGNRTGLAPGKTTRQVEDGLVRKCPPELLRDAHHWLILHGRYVCKARLPECWRCPALRFCNYGDKVLVPPVARAKAG